MTASASLQRTVARRRHVTAPRVREGRRRQHVADDDRQHCRRPIAARRPSLEAVALRGTRRRRARRPRCSLTRARRAAARDRRRRRRSGGLLVQVAGDRQVAQREEVTDDELSGLGVRRRRQRAADDERISPGEASARAVKYPFSLVRRQARGRSRAARTSAARSPAPAQANVARSSDAIPVPGRNVVHENRAPRAHRDASRPTAAARHPRGHPAGCRDRRGRGPSPHAFPRRAKALARTRRSCRSARSRQSRTSARSTAADPTANGFALPGSGAMPRSEGCAMVSPPVVWRDTP